MLKLFLVMVERLFLGQFFFPSSDREADVVYNGYTRSCAQPLLFLASGTDQSA